MIMMNPGCENVGKPVSMDKIKSTIIPVLGTRFANDLPK
jgi:hypothetical protein